MKEKASVSVSIKSKIRNSILICVCKCKYDCEFHFKKTVRVRRSVMKCVTGLPHHLPASPCYTVQEHQISLSDT